MGLAPRVGERGLQVPAAQGGMRAGGAWSSAANQVSLRAISTAATLQNIALEAWKASRASLLQPMPCSDLHHNRQTLRVMLPSGSTAPLWRLYPTPLIARRAVAAWESVSGTR